MSDRTLMMVTYNRLDLTKETLEKLWKNTRCSFNLVIIDNGSTDGTVEFLKELELCDDQPSVLHKLDITYLPENKGIATGRNMALKRADEIKTKWYCTIDNDVELPEGWLSECIEILDANKAYGAVGVNFEIAPFPIVTRGGHSFQDKAAGNLGTACMVFRSTIY